MNKTVKWFLLNSTAVTVIVLAFFFGIEGAYNLTVAIVIVNTLGSLGFLAEEGHKLLRMRGRSVPEWVDISVDLAALAIFAWFGSFILFALQLMGTTLQVYGWSKAEKLVVEAES